MCFRISWRFIKPVKVNFYFVIIHIPSKWSFKYYILNFFKSLFEVRIYQVLDFVDILLISLVQIVLCQELTKKIKTVFNKFINLLSNIFFQTMFDLLENVVVYLEQKRIRIWLILRRSYSLRARYLIASLFISNIQPCFEGRFLCILSVF